MTRIKEGKLTFEFPAAWSASQFDRWSFFRKQFSKISGMRAECGQNACGGHLTCGACGRPGFLGTKAVDILAIEVTVCCWCIEVKDYSRHQRTKVIDLADEIAIKVRDTLAALAAAAANANDNSEKVAATAALRCGRFRIVLHLEQPAKPSKLFPRAIDPAKILERLKQLVKSIDPHPRGVESARMQQLAWTCT